MAADAQVRSTKQGMGSCSSCSINDGSVLTLGISWARKTAGQLQPLNRLREAAQQKQLPFFDCSSLGVHARCN